MSELEDNGAVPYEREIMDAISLLHKDWMDDEDKALFNSEIIKEIGGMKKLSDDIATGVSNGYSVESQIQILKSIISGI